MLSPYCVPAVGAVGGGGGADRLLTRLVCQGHVTTSNCSRCPIYGFMLRYVLDLFQLSDHAKICTIYLSIGANIE